MQTRILYDTIEESASKTKIAYLKKKDRDKLKYECALRQPQQYQILKMKEYANRLPTVGLLPVI